MLSLSIAARFLRKSPVQSILIAAGIAVGIGVQVFLGSLITSLQASLVNETIGNSPQLVVTAGTDGEAVTYTAQLKQAMEEQSEITTVVPTRAFSAIFRQGSESSPLQFTGGELVELDTIYDLSGRIVAGEASLDAGEVLVGKDFADTYALKPGDTATFVLPSGDPAELGVAGVFDFGSSAANSATAFVSGGEAATVLGLSADEYSAIDAQVDDVFSSGEVAASLRSDKALDGLTVTEWQEKNADLLSALQSQSLVELHDPVLRADRSGARHRLHAGHLRSAEDAADRHPQSHGHEGPRVRAHLPVAGADPRRERRRGRRRGRPRPDRRVHLPRAELGLTFPITPELGFVAISFAVGVLVAMASSLIPSRRTSKLDPIEVIQGG